jgi:hypothetical protein
MSSPASPPATTGPASGDSFPGQSGRNQRRFRAGAATVLVALPARRRVHYGNLARAVGVQRSVLRQAEPDDLARIAADGHG